jgi:hypothetical protein
MLLVLREVWVYDTYGLTRYAYGKTIRNIGALLATRQNPDFLLISWLSRHQESTKMGAVYELAYLRIAAAGASHCEEGLFGDRVCPPMSVIFQCDVDEESEEVVNHMIYFQVSGGPRNDPQDSLLATRAWCFQEARLSRRTVSFMRPGVCWDCRDLSDDAFDERDCFRNYRRVNWTNWESNIEEYSCGQLTFESDRLTALEGLANEFSKRWKDAHYFGTLRDGLPRQLLWRTDRPQFGMTGLPELCLNVEVQMHVMFARAITGGANPNPNNKL